jgi:hypothetical protein
VAAEFSTNWLRDDYRSYIGVSPGFTITGATSGEESANRDLRGVGLQQSVCHACFLVHGNSL